jgi:hypothetical protein
MSRMIENESMNRWRGVAPHHLFAVDMKYVNRATNNGRTTDAVIGFLCFRAEG